MRFAFCLVVFVGALLPGSAQSQEAGREKGDGATSLFDGVSLDGWKGDPRFWSLQDGAITGITTKDNATRGNTFIVYQDEIKGDFELTFDYRIEGHNSGVQYRSFVLGDGSDPYRIGGYQADFDAARNWAGTLYGEKFRGVLAKRGERSVLKEMTKEGPREKLVREVESLGDPAELAKSVKAYPAWNRFRVVAQGYRFQHYINGTLMIDCVDNDEANRRNKGLIALQLHQGPPMKVQLKNVRLKQ